MPGRARRAGCGLARAGLIRVSENELMVAVAEAVAIATGASPCLVSVVLASGTSFDQAAFLSLGDGSRWFVKLAPLIALGRFEGEAAGLRALAEPGILRVPHTAVAGALPGVRRAKAGRAFVAMEAIARDRPAVDAWSLLGRQLAEHHRSTRRDRFGFDRDNHCGATPQPNPWTPDGIAFWRHQRLGHQLRLAEAAGRADAALSRAVHAVLDQLDDLLDADEPACLLHGDLWFGNVLVDAVGGPAVIDPAAYWGHREAELAMADLFGGFPSDFFAAYDAAWPLRDGAAERRDVFALYHLLNHLNLFGSGYYDRCLRVARGCAT